MSFFRSFLFLCIACMFASGLLLFLGFFSGNTGYRGGYAVLSADDSLDDRETKELLNEGRKFGGPVFSESTQWVILDDFGSIETVPLENFSSRLASYDPRNDGYAEKLKNFFVRDNKRFFYIPLKTGNSVPSKLDRQFKELLGNIPFSVDYFGIGKPYLLYFLGFAAAAAAVAIVCCVKKIHHAACVSTIMLLPVFSCLAFLGSSGIAVSALFLGIFFMLREPLNEIAALFFSKEKIDKKELIFKNAVEPYRIYWLFLPVFAAAIGLIAVLSRLNVFLLLAVLVLSSAVFFLSLKTLSKACGKHTRFSPVQIIRRRFVDFSFSAYMLPFFASSFLVMLLSPFFSGRLESNGESYAFVIEEKEYYAHLAFQSSFSMRKLAPAASADEYYPAFTIDKDGLPLLDEKTHILSNFMPDKFPAFPLKHLMDFLISVNKGGKMKRTGFDGTRENLSLLILMIFIFPGFLLNGKISFPQRGKFSGLKWFTRNIFNQRRTDKTRKNALLYTSGNTFQLRKDA